MPYAPFDGLIPAADSRHAEWVVAGLRPPPGVGFRVPGGFESIVRVHHPLFDGRRWSDAVAAGDDDPSVAATREGPDAAEGSLDAEILDLLVPVLSASTSTPDLTHFGLWLGWGDLRPGGMYVWSDGRNRWPWSALVHRRARAEADRARTAQRQRVHALMDRCPSVDWWGRHMALFDGPVDAVRAIGTAPLLDGRAPHRLHRRSPQWWWPADRSWFYATEIDDAWTYVAGPGALTEAVLRLGLDAIRVDHHDAR